MTDIDNIKYEKITIRISEYEKEKLKELAKKERRSLSEYIRLALEEKVLKK